jgi:rubrerythrin
LGRGKHRTYPEENNSKEKALRKKIKDQEQEIKRLKSELKTLNKVLQNNTQYIDTKLDKISVENVIEKFDFIEEQEKKEQKAVQEKIKIKSKEAEACCPSCGNSIKVSPLPFGKLRTCVSGCGWRDVVKTKE